MNWKTAILTRQTKGWMMLTEHENTPVRQFDAESANPRMTIYLGGVWSLAYTLDDPDLDSRAWKRHNARDCHLMRRR